MCSTVIVGKVDRLGKRAIVTEVDRTRIEWQRGPIEQIRQHTAILGVPSTGGLIRFLDSRIAAPRGEIQLIVQQDFQPQNSPPSRRVKGFLNRRRAEISR